MRIFITRLEHRCNWCDLVPESILDGIAFVRGDCKAEWTLDTKSACPFGGRKSSRSAALVAMMQSTDLWERDNLACSGGENLDRGYANLREGMFAAEREIRETLDAMWGRYEGYANPDFR